MIEIQLLRSLGMLELSHLLHEGPVAVHQRDQGFLPRRPLEVLSVSAGPFPGVVDIQDRLHVALPQFNQEAVEADQQRVIVHAGGSLQGRFDAGIDAVGAITAHQYPEIVDAQSQQSIREGFLAWMTEAAGIIREIDPNHLISTGNEGLMGCEQDTLLLRQVNEIPGIDYMTIHIWPYNWSWAAADSLVEDLPVAIENTSAYLRLHRRLADELGMPVVAEEFGFPRDGFSPDMSATTKARDSYYNYVFSTVGTLLDGANFWGWSGLAVPNHVQWESGDPYTGDPAQEAQGLNGVYASDSTTAIIKQSITNLNY